MRWNIEDASKMKLEDEEEDRIVVVVFSVDVVDRYGDELVRVKLLLLFCHWLMHSCLLQKFNAFGVSKAYINTVIEADP